VGQFSALRAEVWPFIVKPAPPVANVQASTGICVMLWDERRRSGPPANFCCPPVGNL